MDNQKNAFIKLRYSHEESLQRTETDTNKDFIREWVSYGQARTDAPVEFHEAGGIVLIATVINRNRWLQMSHKRIYPNVYISLLAPSGRRKTTPIEYAEEACPDRFLLPQDFSREALIKCLSMRKPSRGTILVDEAGKLLGTMQKKGYAEGLKDAFSRFWDCPERDTRILMNNEFSLLSVYVNVLMATTESRFMELLTPEDILSGFLPRFLPVVVTRKINRKPIESMGTDLKDKGDALAEWLNRLADNCEKNPGPMGITPDAEEELDKLDAASETWADGEFHQDLLDPWGKRLADYSYHLSIIFAISEDQDTITLDHVHRVLPVIERAKHHVKYLVEELTVSDFVRDADKLMRVIQHDPGITKREVCRRTKLSAVSVSKLARDLQDREEIIIEHLGSRSDRYRPTPPNVTVTPDLAQK